MALKKTAGISIAALMFAAATAQAHDGKYVQDGYGVAVKDSYKECVLAMYGNMLEGCEAEAAPAPVPAPAPVTAPTPRRAPPPVIVPKVKAKGNYKGAVQMDQSERSTMQRYQK